MIQAYLNRQTAIQNLTGFVTGLLLVFVPLSIQGQRIRFYNSEQGLPNSLIHKVAQDDYGYIWIATENGASYFDGMRFTTFRHNPDQTETLANNLVKIVFTDSRGTTWIGTANGLQIYNRENNTFRDFPLQCPSFTSTPYVTSITEDREHGKLLVSVAGLGVVVYNLKNHQIDPEITRSLKEIYGTNYVGTLFIDHEGFLWSHAEQGNFFRVNLQKKEIEKLQWSPALKEQSKKFVVSAITEDAVHRILLIGTHNHGLFIYDRSLGAIRRPRGTSSSTIRIRALLAETKEGNDNEFNIWVGTEDTGLKKFDRESEEIVKPDFRYAPIDLDNCKVHSIMQDAQGNIWAGIYQKGLLIIPRSTNDFEYIKLSASKGSMSVNLACVTSITRDHNGTLWVGTDGGGLFKMLEDGSNYRYTKDNTPLPNNAILSITPDKRGMLWISTYMGGVTCHNQRSGFKTYSNSPELQKVTCSVFDEKNDKLYLGTLGHGVKVLSFPDLLLENFPEKNRLIWISSLCLDASGNLWVGHTEGVGVYNTKNGDELTVPLADRIKGISINAMLEDEEGSMWLCSSDGLFHYQKENDTLILYSKDEGLPSNQVCAVQKDANGILWISTLHGLARFNAQSTTSKNFYAYDGLQDNEFINKASYRDSDGKLFFGGINGITAFYPDNIKCEEKLQSGIYFSQLTVLNQDVNYNESQGNKNILDRHISQARQITLKKSQNVFSLEFSVLEYANPQKVVYGYMLEGFDSEWRFTGSDNRRATYTNLPEGSYNFRVKAFFDGSSEDQNTVYNHIHIRILPPWYKSAWAYLIYLALLAFMVWAFIDFLKRRRNRIQERLELEKKEMKLRMFTDLTHEIRTPFTLVMTPLKSMKDTETDSKRKEVFSLMYRNILRILRLLNQLMDIRKVDNHQLKLQFQKTDLIDFIHDIIKSFEQLAILRNIDFRLISNFESLEVWIDQVNFDKVLFNLLSNAFKFTPDHGYILISLDTKRNNAKLGLSHNITDYIELSIENSGSKIEEGETERIFDRFYQSSNSTSAGGSGIGLHLAKMIVELHHGKIKAANTENGVVFTAYIPLTNKHLSQKEMADTESGKDIYTKIRRDLELSQEIDFVELPQDEEGITASKKSKSKRTLVFVDDDIDLGKYVRMELFDKYKVEVCNNAIDAWKVISTTLPDAIIVDLIMPEEDGISLCRKIRKNPETNHLPVIILTSQTDEENERHCIESGADHFLTKPFSLDLLKSTLAQAIQTRERIRNKYRSNVNPDFDSIKVSSPDSRLIAKVIETIRKNIENPEFGVDDLSREAGLSRVHLNRKLKENINTSPSNLIRSIRLKQAAYLLINNKVNISDVAYKVGFSSHSYFSNNFKEYFGMAPTEFIHKYTESEEKESLNKLFEK
ncbi:MAG: response regulator [Bacteroidales bacterium]|nr:response regulator [Bacteroidales bacterium]MBN2764407.1 response regulator [Bacteroidales bacterium]